MQVVKGWWPYLIALGLLVLPRLFAQSPAELRTQLEAAAAHSTLEDPQLIPWHLKLDVQLFDAKGNAAETGTVEEWWTKPGVSRVQYSFPSYTGVAVHTAESSYYSAGPGAPPVMADTLLRQVVHPLPDADELRTVTPDNRKEKFSGTDYDCIMLDQPIKNVAYPPLGLFPTYCFQHSQVVLGVSFEYGQELTLRTRVGSFQKKTVALSLTIQEAGVKAGTAQVSVLQGQPSPYPEASDIAGLVPSVPAAGVAGGVIAGSIVSKVPPRYPQSAKDRHVSGTVVMKAIIGRDGHVRQLKLAQVPDADLAIAALAAVRQWTYKPYLLNGEPTEVDTTITVNFMLGP